MSTTEVIAEMIDALRKSRPNSELQNLTIMPSNKAFAVFANGTQRFENWSDIETMVNKSKEMASRSRGEAI